MSNRLTIRTQQGAALRIEATNEEDAKRELMEKYKLAIEKLADFEEEEIGYLICDFIGKPVIDDIGRLFLPSKIREEAGIETGDTLRLTVANGKIIIKKETKK